MSLFENANDILLLKKLLDNHGSDDSDSDSENEHQPKSKNLGPSNFGPKPKSTVVSREIDDSPKPETKKNVTIEEWLEEQEKEDKEILETRKRPEYTISYKQRVGTEDVFLQMGHKTSASSSCEDMITEIKMPEETVGVHQMNISVTETEIDLATPVYRLKLPLPHPINPDKSSAKYFSERKILCLTCRMNREYDFVNF